MKLLALLLISIFSASAYAGYADVVPPPQLRPSPGGGWTYKPSFPANDHSFNGWRHIRGTLPISGNTPVPMAVKYAANAGRFVGLSLLSNPALLIAAAAAGPILDWLNQDDPNAYKIQNGQLMKGSTKYQSNCQHMFDTGDAGAMQSYIQAGHCLYDTVRNPDGTTTYKIGNVGQASPTLEYKPINPQTFPDEVEDLPITAPIPEIIPDPLPVENPVINPNVNPDALPDNAPFPGEARPFLVPTGDPEPIPQTDPQRYRQPWTEVTPSPTPERPLRVDTRPIVTESDDPTPITDPIVQTTSPQAPDPENKAPDETSDLCANNPDILACQKLGTPETSEIPRSQQPITLQQGPSFGGGSCPPNVQITVLGRTLEVVDMSTFCGWISTYLRPLILLMASFSALFIVYPKGD